MSKCSTRWSEFVPVVSTIQAAWMSSGTILLTSWTIPTKFPTSWKTFTLSVSRKSTTKMILRSTSSYIILQLTFFRSFPIIGSAYTTRTTSIGSTSRKTSTISEWRRTALWWKRSLTLLPIVMLFWITFFMLIGLILQCL